MLIWSRNSLHERYRCLFGLNLCCHHVGHAWAQYGSIIEVHGQLIDCRDSRIPGHDIKRVFSSPLRSQTGNRKFHKLAWARFQSGTGMNHLRVYNCCRSRIVYKPARPTCNPTARLDQKKGRAAVTRNYVWHPKQWGSIKTRAGQLWPGIMSDTQNSEVPPKQGPGSCDQESCLTPKHKKMTPECNEMDIYVYILLSTVTHPMYDW